jgi:hypothetical protein
MPGRNVVILLPPRNRRPSPPGASLALHDIGRWCFPDARRETVPSRVQSPSGQESRLGLPSPGESASRRGRCRPLEPPRTPPAPGKSAMATPPSPIAREPSRSTARQVNTAGIGAPRRGRGAFPAGRGSPWEAGRFSPTGPGMGRAAWGPRMTSRSEKGDFGEVTKVVPAYRALPWRTTAMARREPGTERGAGWTALYIERCR